LPNLSDKPDAQTQQPTSAKEQSESEEEKYNCQVDVKSPLQIDIVQRLREEVKTANNQSSTQSEKQIFWTKVAAGLVLLYTLVSAFQLKVARDTFDAANRPYIGVNGIGVEFLQHQVTNAGQISPVPTAETTALAFRVEIKNFGPVPGTNSKLTWRVFLDGIELPQTKVPDSRQTIFPGESVFLTGNTSEVDYAAVQSGGKTLAIDVWVDYFGPSGHYTECQRSQYRPQLAGFFNLGAQCAPN
jgi:hypothetical protein